MHFKSNSVDGYVIYAVSGTNTVSFAIDYSQAITKGLLGFGVERFDPKENERYFMYGFKVFPSVIPFPSQDTIVSTYDQPIQSFVWDDFTAKPDREYRYFFHPLKGKPKNIDRSAPPVEIGIRTEPLFTNGEHDIFFNRGVASSQAYARQFDNKAPDKIADPIKRQAALDWLSRDLDEALVRFIDNAQAGDTLLGCFYEFRYLHVVKRLTAATDRGVTVKLILDAKDNAHIDKKTGKLVESFPLEDNRRTVTEAGLPADSIACWRAANPGDIQHNKFLVLLRGDPAVAQEVWTGSTNLSDGGIHGQTNVGHWLRNKAAAAAFTEYWKLLATDPGSLKGDPRAKATAKKAAYREAVMTMLPTPGKLSEIPAGVTPVFSPRKGLSVLEMYVETLDAAESLACITLAFGVNALFKSALADNTRDSHISFLMLEKEDKPNPKKPDAFVRLSAKHNVYQAWGSYLRDNLYRWTREVNAGILKLNRHVAYIHSKFLLKDPLGADPIVITGSANFSNDSTDGNDENMIIIRGNGRVADIYFTEFNRLFFHYYFRSVHQAIQRRAASTGNAAADEKASLFLSETDEWLGKYKPGSLRAKRVGMFTVMANPQII